ncbi:DUF1800 family protein [Usitatibacter palustris]|uniref:DUF1800 domain-containing protein n=1 Tax=Usitatibacter palustris TaxID=2732487 RepID=A0A6M4HAY1_9PROT|nr:DUF1800 family protein [Usitatibacter palustris]QJR15187.1 hypothetical protein DSM104440_02004 [Usitatibacter palustris]
MNTQQPTRFAAWLLAARRSLRLLAMVALLVVPSLQARAANFTDIWWNPSESGWGVALSHHHDKIFGLLYIYDADGKPLWVSMPDGKFENNGRTYVGSLYRTTGPSYRAAFFNPTQVNVSSVGTARIDFGADDQSATMQVTIGSYQSTKQVKRYSFGNAPSNYPNDRSDIWWNPDESGWGLTLNHNGNNIFGVLYTYDETGRPLWVTMPGGTFTEANQFNGKLYTTTGSPYTAAFEASKVKTTEVGNISIEFINGDEARLTISINGFTRSRPVRRFAFGTDPGIRPPKVDLSINATASPLVAPATVTLRAAVTAGDRPVSKVVFYEGCDRIGEATAAPWEFKVASLSAGNHTFSARALDDSGSSGALDTESKEVKTGGTAPPPPPTSTTNKLPTVAITSPPNNAVVRVGTNLELIAAASDPDGTIVKVEFFTGPYKMGEATAAPWRLVFPNSSEAGYAVTAVATDDRGGTKTSSVVNITTVGTPPVLDSQTKDAARFLTQATFGIKSIAEIENLKAIGFDAWLNQQIPMVAPSFVQYVNDRKAAGEKPDEERAYEAIWQQWLWQPGQLRARMAFALSELFVISNIAPDLDTYAMASYWDMLNAGAFGNYRNLLENVTLHPAMGYYLNMIGSRKADPVKGTHPNENFAREVMQLFTIGLYKLNIDGSRVLDSAGKPINTYDETVIKGMAAAFTGWNFAGADTSKPSTFNPPKENWLEPMASWESMHDTNAKPIFDGIVLPANQTAAQDMKAALDALFNHPNVGPFVGRQLIQRFVTSNPSPQYIARVAAAFNRDPGGVRGNLLWVLREVLYDPEARSLAKATEAGWGKQREPVIRFANFLRGLNATSPTGRNKIWYLDSADEGLNQSPLLSPSVFNFFSPNYRQPGPLSAANLVAPEFQITTETSMVGTLNFFARLVKNGSYGSGDTKLTMDLTQLNALAGSPGALADHLSLLFMNGAMSEALRTTMVITLSTMPMPATKTGDSGATITDRVKAALMLVALSPDYVIQK